jgi:DNA-binding NarL/FixJ family response regulator
MTGRVLIVEDDHLTALSLRALLDLVGFEIVGTASRVKDALTQAEQTSPEMAIFDVRLAGKRDGIEGATLLRELLDIPVVLLTARTDTETEARASIARPAAILQKPVPSKVFISAVRKAMQETRATECDWATRQATDRPNSTREGCLLRRILVVEDEPIVAELVASTLTDAGYEVIGIAADECSAVKQAQRADPELVVMDIKLANNSDGVEVARRLQYGRSVSVLFASAYLDRRTIERAATVNPVGFLGKPYSPQSLLQAVAAAEEAATGSRRAPGTYLIKAGVF